MRSAPMPRILYISDSPHPGLRPALEAVGFPVLVSGVSGIESDTVSDSQLILLEAHSQNLTTIQGLCRRWRIELGEHFIPIFCLGSNLSSEQEASLLESGADVVRSLAISENYAISQIKALLRIQHLNVRLGMRASEAHQVNQRLQQAYQQMDNDLELTRRIHRGFLPQTLPEVGQMRFAVQYRPRSRVGGDFYDVMRLDEEHVGIYVADAMGRGLPASSLLSIFVKKAIRAKEIIGRSYRLIPPDEILAELNRQLVALNLADPPFVTMLWVQLNCRDGAVSFARAAHPHPLYIPLQGELRYWHSSGSLLGVFESDFPVQREQLLPGDKLLLFSDGVQPAMQTGMLTSADFLIEVAQKHRHLELPSLIDQVSQELIQNSRQQEDFTLLGVEFLPER